MTIDDLAQCLHDERCNPHLYAIGTRGAASDEYCLTYDRRQWRVFYTERGVDSAPTYTSPSESEACAHFFELIMAMRHDHCVGIFASYARAAALRERLAGVGVEPWEDRIPYRGPDDPRFRVVATGKAIFAATAELGAPPVRDESA